MEKINVIIPCYNVEKYIEKTITSLLNQTYKDFTIYCIDDCSTDGTYSKLQELSSVSPKIKLFKNDVNLGVIGTLNKLIDLCNSEYIIRMDSDDIFEKDRIEKLLNKAEQNLCHIVSSSYSFIDFEGNQILNKRALNLCTLDKSIKFMALLNSPFPSQALFCSRLFDVKKFPNNRIIIFPQTLHYESINVLEEDKAIFNSHPDFTLCVRDTISFEFAKKHFYNCNVILLPDMAFFCDFSNFVLKSKSNNTLLLKRNDKEFGSNDKFIKIFQDLKNNKINFDILDWPSIELKGISKNIDIYLNVMNTIFSKVLKSTFLINNATGLKGKNYRNKRVLAGIEFINKYDTVYSTRLHGFILSVLLGKTVYILDNSYGKNKNFFNTWLTDFENVKLID